jgi:hypothetical protein
MACRDVASDFASKFKAKSGGGGGNRIRFLTSNIIKLQINFQDGPSWIVHRYCPFPLRYPIDLPASHLC